MIDADAATALADKDWDRLTNVERRALSHSSEVNNQPAQSLSEECSQPIQDGERE